MNAHNSMLISQSFIQQWLDFMHLVTSVVLVECIENIFVPPQYGKEQHHITTLYLSRLIQSSLGWEAWHLNVFFFSFLLCFKMCITNVLSFIGIPQLELNQTRQRYRAVGGKTRIWGQWLLQSGHHPFRLHHSKCTYYWCLWVFLPSRRILFFSFFGLISRPANLSWACASSHEGKKPNSHKHEKLGSFFLKSPVL